MVMAGDEGLRDGPGLLQSMRRHLLLVVVVVVVFAAGAIALSLAQPQTFSSSAQLYLADPRTQSVLGTTGRVSSPDEYVPQQADRVKARAVLDRAAAELEGVTTPEVRGRAQVTGDPELNLITITASGPTATEAADTANALAKAYMAFAEERIMAAAEETVVALQQRIDQLDAEIAELEAQVRSNPDDTLAQSRLQIRLAQLNEYEARTTEVTVQATTYGSGVDQFEPAEPPREPATASPVTYGVLGTLFGLIVAASVAYWQAGRTTALESAQQPAHILGAPLLGEIPAFKKLRVGSAEASVMDHYGFLLAALDFELRAINGQAVLVTSAEEGEGKTTTALQLAMAAASAGRRTALVDGDLRRRTLSDRLGLGAAPGLVEVATGHAMVTECVRPTTVDGEHLAVLPSGTSGGETARILRSPQLADALQDLRGHAELVVVDSAPVLAVPDTSVLAAQLDGVIVVIRAERARIPDLQLLKERLSFVSAPLLGYIWVSSKPNTTGSYGYAHERGDHGRATKTPTPSPTSTQPVSDRSGVPQAWGAATRPPERRP